LPLSEAVNLDSRVLLFTLVASMFSGIQFGLAPALKTSGANVHETLKEGGRGGSGERHRLQGTLVVVEISVALVLLVGAGLMIRCMAKLWSVNPGFDPHNSLSFAFSYPTSMGETPDAMRAAMRQLHSAVSSAPGVQAASLTIGALPMAGDSDLPFWIEGEPKPTTQAEMKISLFYSVEPEYLQAMGIPLLRGRFLEPTDTERSPFVMVVDEEFAKLAFHGQDPIGKSVNIAFLDMKAQIVGVVGHVKQWGLDEDAHSPIRAQFYFPIWQLPDRFMPLLARGVTFVTRTAGKPAGEMAAIRQAIAKVNSEVVTYRTATMEEIVADSLAARQFAMVLLAIFAALALMLSCVGIYGVISYLVGQRTHEIGVRMALGAQRRDVLQMILGQGAKMAFLGVGIGLAASLGLTRLMDKILFGVSSRDPLTMVAVGMTLVAVALLACYIPARRAMRVDPMVALRYE